MGRTLRHSPPEATGSIACSKCGGELRPDAFYWKLNGKLQHRQCKACTAAYSRSRYTPTPRGDIPCKRCGVPFAARPEGGRHFYCSSCKVEMEACRPGEIHLDHLVPVSAGGDHSPANLRVACAACNLSKRAAARNEQLLLVG